MVKEMDEEDVASGEVDVASDKTGATMGEVDVA